MSLFPSVQPALSTPRSAQLPTPVEVAWDFDRGVPVFRSGAPLTVSGLEAIRVWAWKTLHTPRYRHPIYSYSYGNDAYGLIGKAYTEQLKHSEAARMIREALTVNPYITDVADVEVSFSDDGTLSVSCTVKTIYGEVNLSV